MRRNSIIFWATLILAVCFLVQLLGYGVRHSFSIFFPFILDEYQWARGDTALMLSIHLLVYGICAPIAGTMVTRLPPKQLILFGIVVLSMATAACYLATELWHF